MSGRFAVFKSIFSRFENSSQLSSTGILCKSTRQFACGPRILNAFCIGIGDCEGNCLRWQHRQFSNTRYAASKIVNSRFPDVEIPNQSFAEYVIDGFHEYEDEVALIDGVTNDTMTYAQLRDASIKCAHGLVGLGIGKGDVLALFTPNLFEYAVVILGASSIGAVVSTINPLSTVDELARQLEVSESKFVFTVPELVETARKAANQVQGVKEVIVFGNVDKLRPFSNLLDNNHKLFPEMVSRPSGEDVLVLPFSSGTTGLPKGVMLTHRNIIANMQQCREGLAYSPKDTSVVVLPFFHIYGMSVVLFNALKMKMKLVLLPKFDPELYLGNVQKYKATYLHIVPPMAVFMAKHPMVDDFNLSSVETVVCGAAPLTKNLQEEFCARTNLDGLRQGYGLTETSPVTHLNHRDDMKVGSVGLAVPNTKFKVLHMETGDPLGPNQEGEICVEGPQVMKGYLNNPSATAECIKDGWFHTGDIGYYDEGQYVYVTDRLKELIKYKGYQVAPAELEGLLLNHPAVQDAAVIGVSDEMAGEIPRAFIVKKPNAQVNEEEMEAFVAAKAAPYKKLRGGVQFIEAVPKSASGKILRRLLK